MKSKISRILGVVLSLALMASPLMMPAPVAASPSDATWVTEVLATATSQVMKTGSDVTDIAVADASTIYVVDFGSGTVTTSIYRSTNAGQSFSNITNNYATLAGIAPPRIVAVAPDNKDVVAVSDGTQVAITTDAGTTWTALLPNPSGVGFVTDLAIGPARSGTLLGREYFATCANPVAGVGGAGVFSLGGTTSGWAAVGGAPAGDYMAVAVSPNFLGDRTIVTVFAPNGVAAGVQVAYLNTFSGTLIGGAIIVYAATIGDSGQPAGIVAADIALPSNFDPSTPNGTRCYVGVASTAGGTNDDVWRIAISNFNPPWLASSYTVKDLNADISVKSVAYSGTTDTGKLYAGNNAAAAVMYTAEPTVSSPAWKNADKQPTGATATVVKLATDFATTNRVFVGTSSGAGGNSALSISEDAGVSFVQECFIDNGANNIGLVDGIAVTPDGGTIYVLSRANAGAGNFDLWKSVTPVTSSSWQRIYSIAQSSLGVGVTGAILKVNPDYATTPGIYFIERGAPAAGNKLYVSQTGGISFVSRLAPAANPLAMGVQDAQTIFIGVGTTIYKTKNAGWTYDPAAGVSSGVSTGISDIVIPKTDHVLCGGTTSFSYSTNGGASFTGKTTGVNLAGMGTTLLAVDSDYANNNWVYIGGAAGGANSVRRFQIGTSTQADSMNNPNIGAVVGMAFKNNALYAMGPAAAARVLSPKDVTALAAANWSNGNLMAAGVPAGVDGFNIYGGSSASLLYAYDQAVPNLYTYQDFLVVAKPKIVAPADGYALAVDPNTGFGASVTLKWEQMGSGTGLVTAYDLEVVQKALGFTNTVTDFTGGGLPPVSAVTPFVTIPTQVGVGGIAGFNANMEYLWRVRARAESSGDLIVSPWSDGYTIKVQSGGVVQQPYAGPQLTGPSLGATDLNPTLVGFAWAPVSGATEYQVIVATDSALTKTIAGTPAKVTTTFYQATGLEYGTTYFWAVKATKPTEGVQTGSTFATMDKPVAAPTATAPPATQPPIQVNLPTPETPPYIWAVIVIGAVLVIAVIILIVRTRRVP